jgi:hypothetical protein
MRSWIDQGAFIPQTNKRASLQAGPDAGLAGSAGLLFLLVVILGRGRPLEGDSRGIRFSGIEDSGQNVEALKKRTREMC